MARISYSTSTPFGQLISEGIDYIQQARMNIERSAKAISEMTAEQYQAELGVTQEDYTQFRNRLNDINTHMEDEKLQSLLVIFDQG